MNTNLCRDSAGAYVVRPSANVPHLSDTVTVIRAKDDTYRAADEELGTWGIFRAVTRIGVRGWLTVALLLGMLALIVAAFDAAGALAGGV